MRRMKKRIKMRANTPKNQETGGLNASFSRGRGGIFISFACLDCCGFANRYDLWKVDSRIKSVRFLVYKFAKSRITPFSWFPPLGSRHFCLLVSNAAQSCIQRSSLAAMYLSGHATSGSLLNVNRVDVDCQGKEGWTTQFH